MANTINYSTATAVVQMKPWNGRGRDFNGIVLNL